MHTTSTQLLMIGKDVQSHTQLQYSTSIRMRTESDFLINVQFTTSPLTLGGIVVT